MALGYASPARMLSELRPSELGEWLGFWVISPWGERRADLRAGVVASTMANIHRDSKRRSTPYKPRDFMLFEEPAMPADPAAHNRELSKRLLAAFGLKPKRK